jgi:hypothetical protein
VTLLALLVLVALLALFGFCVDVGAGVLGFSGK